jgi:hypothetical protein
VLGSAANESAFQILDSANRLLPENRTGHFKEIAAAFVAAQHEWRCRVSRTATGLEEIEMIDLSEVTGAISWLTGK